MSGDPGALSEPRRRRIAILDYLLVPTNAIGGCDRLVATHLADEHDFTVFGLEMDNPRPDRVTFVRVPALRRPLFLLFLTYHLMAPVVYAWHRVRTRQRFDVVVGVESNSILGRVRYTQFCHRAYLRDHWRNARSSGVRGAAQWLDHFLHRLLEPVVYRRATDVVVPSEGLRDELLRHYPAQLNGKVTVIPNPVDVDRLRPPDDLDRSELRDDLGLASDDVALVFVALGHFERKGLPLLLEALAEVDDPRLKLMVVGGSPDLQGRYRRRTAELGISGDVIWAGMQTDVRPHLWAADIFAFPSFYETFSLVSFEAAAAGLPLLVSDLYGVQDFVRDGENGWIVEREPHSIAAAIRAMTVDPERLREMAATAQREVRGYSIDAFVDRWRAFYSERSP